VLLQFGARVAGFLARVVVIAREALDLRLLTRLAGKVGAILSHSCAVDDIVLAARLVRPGLTVLSKEFLPLLQAAKAAQAPSNVATRYGLTEREKAVLEMLAKGASNRTIATALGINDITVRVHLRSILHKLGVTNRTQAALFVARGGDDP
jgi:DNA-binding NarL/FixJ family response regulator